jgi:hypothetical protein
MSALGVKSRHVQCKKACPLYPRKRTCAVRLGDLIPADIPILASGIAIGLTGIGSVSLAAYGIVRAIGWVIDKSI